MKHIRDAIESPFHNVRIDDEERRLADGYLHKHGRFVDWLFGVASRIGGMLRRTPSQHSLHTRRHLGYGGR